MRRLITIYNVCGNHDTVHRHVQLYRFYIAPSERHLITSTIWPLKEPWSQTDIMESVWDHMNRSNSFRLYFTMFQTSSVTGILKNTVQVQWRRTGANSDLKIMLSVLLRPAVERWGWTAVCTGASQPARRFAFAWGVLEVLPHHL